MFTYLYFQGFKSQALAVTCDPEHKFELALQLGDLRIAYQLAKEAEVSFILTYVNKNYRLLIIWIG